MPSPAFLTLGLAVTALAADPQIPFMWLEANAGPDVAPVASIITATPATTAFQLGCSANTPASDCYWSGLDIKYTIASASTYMANAAVNFDTYDRIKSWAFSCVGHSSPVCVFTGVAAADTDSAELYTRKETTTLNDNAKVSTLTAIVTAGQEKLSATSPATPNAPSGSLKPTNAGATASTTPDKPSGAAGQFSVHATASAIFAMAATAYRL